MADIEFDPIVWNAAAAGHVDLLTKALSSHRHLIDTPNPHDADERTPLAVAASNGHVSTVEALVRLGSGALNASDRGGEKPIHGAAEHGHVEAVRALVRLGAEIDVGDDNMKRTAFHLAARSGHLHVIEALLQLGSQALHLPCRQGLLPFWYASGHAHVIEALFRLGSKGVDDTDEQGTTPMHSAAQDGHADVVEMLFRLGSQALDAPDDIAECTPLYLAAEAGQPEVIETLIRLGSDAIDTPNDGGLTPVTIALQESNEECARLLIALGAEVDDEYIEELLEEDEEELNLQLSEEEVAQVRHRVYFAPSLFWRLLLDLDRQSVLPNDAQRRISVISIFIGQ